MEATLRLNEETIRTAVQEYLERQGWAVNKVELRAHYNPGDGPHPGGNFVSGEASVTPKPPAYPERDPQRG